MPRIATPNLGLGTWAQGENPGAGSQTVDNTGLNGNFFKLDTAVGEEHNADGTHGTAVIDKGNLKTTVADAVTIELNGTNGLQVKAAGIVLAKLGADVVDDVTTELHPTNGIQVKDSGISGAKLIQTGTGAVVDETTLEFSGNEMRIKDDGVTAPKISHDNNRTKCLLQFTVESNVSGTWAMYGGLQTSSSYAPCMPRAGSVTKVSITGSGGAVHSVSAAYGSKTFNAGDKLTIQFSDGPYSFDVMKNGTPMSYGTTLGTPTLTSWMFVMELEFDD